jgi:hypothetical protein
LADLTLLQMVNDFAVSGGVSFVAYGTTAFVTTAVCSVFATPAAVVVIAGVGSAVVGTYGYQYAMEEVREHFYEHRPMDPRVEMAGHLVGGIVGGYVGVETGAEIGEAIRWRWLYPNYATYEAEARALTEQTYNANRKTIDPKSMRGPASHLDHETSVRMGYEMYIPPAAIAAPQNLRIIPAPQNLSEGARLSSAVMHPAVYTLADEAPVVRPAVCVLGVLDWTRWCGGAVVQ